MSRLLHNIKSVALALAALALAAPSVWGANRNWSGAGGNANWSTAANWGGTVPASGDTVYFRAASPTRRDVVIDSSVSRSAHIYVDQGSSESAPYIWTATSDANGISSSGKNMVIGLNDTYSGWLKITRGTYTFNDIQLGRDSPSYSTTGWLFLDGSANKISTTLNGNFQIHRGTFKTSGNNVTFKVVKDLRVARQNNTTALIENAGSDWTIGKLCVAYGGNSTGTVNLNGGTTTVTGTNIVGVAAGSTANMTINSGATLKTTGTAAGAFLLIGDNATANATLTLNEGGTITDTSKGIVVKNGRFLMNGGTVSTTGGNFHIGNTANLAGALVMNGGTFTVGQDVKLGKVGSGTLTISNGTFTVASGKQIYMCEVNTGNATVNLCGGTLVTKHMSMGPGTAVVNFDGGTLKANNTSNDGLIQATVPVNVGPKGGTIDTGNRAITVPAVLASGVSGETDGGMTFKGGGTVTLTGANTYTGVTVIDAGTTIQMPAANNLAGNIVVTNATFADCPITVLTLTGAGADASDILSRCSLAADAPDTVELTVDGASVKVVQKASAPATARLVYDQGTDSWNWEFRDTTDAVIPSVDQSALEASSITVRFGSTDELAAIGTAPAWVGGWQMTAAFDLVSASVATVFPSEFTIEAGTVIDLKGCNWTLPDGLKSATAAFTVTNSVDATKAVLTVDVASGATFTETHLTLGGNIELRKTGEGTYAMTKDQPHTGGTVVTAGAMTSSANRTVASEANSTGSMTIDGGAFTADADFIVGGSENSTGVLAVNSGTFTMAGPNRYLKLGSASGATGTVNLDGGELVMNARGFTTGNDGSGEVVFNGGTLTYNGSNDRALFQNHLTVKVGAGGGTIAFAAGKYPTNNLSIVSGVAAGETDGGMTFKGGGTFTEKGQLSYTGGTTVEIGTTLVVPDTSLGGGLAATIPETQPAVGTTNILVTTTGEGVFTDSDLPDVTAFPYYRAMLSEDAKSILVVRVAPAMSVTGFNLETGEITLGFENMDGALDLVVAWDTSDHGATLASWPSGKSVVLGTVAAGTTTATFTLPDEVQTVGTYYRLFLGDSATKPYDEEVAWIQPNGVGACIRTTFTPTKLPRFETKINLTGNAIESGCDYGSIHDAGTGNTGGVWVFCNAAGKIGARRYGYAYSSKTYSGDVTLYGIWSVIKSSAPNATFMVNSDVVWANGFNNTMSGNPSVVRFWDGFKGSADGKQFGASAYRFIYSKWWNSGKTTLEADFIPVKKGNEYGLYDKIGKKVYLNAGAEGTSFKGGAKTANGPVTFADGQMGASDTQQYLGATVLDQENCSITMDGATATINWALTQPGGPSADIVAVFTTGSTAVTNVLATGVATASNGVATVENVYATGGIDITLFARSGDNKSVEVSANFPATTVASVPTAPVLSVDETLHQIAATGMVTLGTGTTVAWLDYGATTSYGKRIDLTLDAGTWSATIPYDDALWNAGKVYVRVKTVNEIAGIFGTSRQERTATANASFTKAETRTITLTAFNRDNPTHPTTGTATLAFGGEAAAAQDLVIAWGDHDYGENIGSWPRANRKVIGSVAVGDLSGTYTLPPEALVSGTYYRFFLGDRAVAPYDEEVEWLQPEVSGAYINTGYTPASTDKAEFKFNMDNQVYDDDDYRTIFAAGSGWQRTMHTAVNRDGWMSNVRAGTIRFAAKGSNNIVTGFDRFADHVVKIVYQGDVDKFFTIDDKTGNNIYHEYTDGSATVTSTWNTYNNTFYGPNSSLKIWANGSSTPSMVKLYYMKWMNSSGTVIHEYIPVVKSGEYCLYDINTAKVLHNVGTEGTSFTGGSRTGYSPLTFEEVQTAVSSVRMVGTVEITERDWARPNENVTLEWSASSVATKLWVAYSTEPISAAPGEFADPSAWNFCTNIASVAANETTGTYALGDPLGDGNRYKTMRFILSKDGDTLVPLLVSEPYRTLKQGSVIYMR